MMRGCPAMATNPTPRSQRLDVPAESRRGILTWFKSWMNPETFGDVSEQAARFIGSWRFIAYMSVFVFGWIAYNVAMPAASRPDAYPFIFLTLLLSLQASYAAPLILLAQNRQADRDRVQNQYDRDRTERIVAESEYLSREVADLRVALGDVATRDFVRGELSDALEDLQERLDAIKAILAKGE